MFQNNLNSVVGDKDRSHRAWTGVTRKRINIYPVQTEPNNNKNNPSFTSTLQRLINQQSKYWLNGTEVGRKLNEAKGYLNREWKSSFYAGNVQIVSIIFIFSY